MHLILDFKQLYILQAHYFYNLSNHVTWTAYKSKIIFLSYMYNFQFGLKLNTELKERVNIKEFI